MNHNTTTTAISGGMFAEVHGQNEAKLFLQKLIIKPFLSKKESSSFVSILFIGPPGCGKTYLGKALAEELKGLANFCHLHSSTILGHSKNDDEQIRYLEDEIKRVIDTRPHVFFLDDLASEDAMFPCAFKSTNGQTLTKELAKLNQSKKQGCSGVALIGATQSPWNLDKHLWELKLKLDDRLTILNQNLEKIDLEAGTIEELAKNTGQYTGADLKVLCSSICAIPLRAVLNATNFKVKFIKGKHVCVPCSALDEGAVATTLDDFKDCEPSFDVIRKDDTMKMLSPLSRVDNKWQKYEIFEESNDAGKTQ